MNTHSENHWLPPPSRMCEPAQVQHRKTNDPWPFLYSYQNGTVTINKVKTTTKYKQVIAIGDAQF